MFLTTPLLKLTYTFNLFEKHKYAFLIYGKPTSTATSRRLCTNKYNENKIVLETVAPWRPSVWCLLFGDDCFLKGGWQVLIDVKDKLPMKSLHGLTAEKVVHLHFVIFIVMCSYYHEQSSIIPSVVCISCLGKSFSSGQLLLYMEALSLSNAQLFKSLWVISTWEWMKFRFFLDLLPAHQLCLIFSIPGFRHRVKLSFTLAGLHAFTCIASRI